MSRDLAAGEVRFEHVSKRYALGARRTHWREALPWGSGVAGGQYFSALDDVSFEVRSGEAFALVGANGAGKSTALKCLAGLTSPSSGRISVGGRVVALIELGIGFHPDLSGRENARFAAALGGLRGRAADSLVDQAVDFAEMSRFIDTPVKRYSSGMLARLSFGIATCLPADLLIVDEVLAVGDLAFQRKCYEHLHTLRTSGGVTLLFVSHNEWVLKETCDRGLLLVKGRVTAEGPVAGLLSTYRATLDSRETLGAGTVLPGQRIVIRDVSLITPATPVVALHGQMELLIDVEVDPGVARPALGVIQANKDRQIIWASYSDQHGVALRPGRQLVRFVVDDIPMQPGPAVLEIAAFDRDSPAAEASRLLDFVVVGDGESKDWEHGLVDVASRWMEPHEAPPDQP